MTIDLTSLIDRPLRIAHLIRSIDKTLHEEQLDALEGFDIRARQERDDKPTSSEPQQPSTISYNDPTGALAGLLAPYAARERRIREALAGVDRALDIVEHALDAAISTRAPANLEQRCPGWTAELRARLGGCGNILETYRTADGIEHVRSTWLCVGCRRASERAERQAEREREDAA